jgi:preprotein translocase subunit SecD
MSRLSVLIILALVPLAGCAQELPHCDLSVYPINTDGVVARAPILTKEHVLSIKKVSGPETKIHVAGQDVWQVSLTPEGARINSEYTESHIGDALQFVCGSKPVASARIIFPSGASFAFTTDARAP